MKTSTIKAAKLLSSVFRSTVLEPTVKSDMMFSAATGICASHGQLVKCSLLGNVSRAIVGQSYTVSLHTSSFSGGKCAGLSKSIDCELVSDWGAKKLSVQKSNVHGKYRISYSPSAEGNHQLHIKVGGHHIGGSPFTIAAVSKHESQRHITYELVPPSPFD